MTQGDLLLLAKLGIEQASLSRKLSGLTPLSTDEAEALADALRCEIKYSPRARSRSVKAKR